MRFSRSGLVPSTVAIEMAFDHPDMLVRLDVQRALRVLAYLDWRAIRRG